MLVRRFKHLYSEFKQLMCFQTDRIHQKVRRYRSTDASSSYDANIPFYSFLSQNPLFFTKSRNFSIICLFKTNIVIIMEESRMFLNNVKSLFLTDID